MGPIEVEIPVVSPLLLLLLRTNTADQADGPEIALVIIIVTQD
jgi:hypothetical protein